MPVHSIRRFVLFALAISLTSIFAASASAAPKEGRYIVVLKDSVQHPGVIAEDQADETGGDVSLVYRSALKGYAATLPEGAVAELERDPKVDYVTPDRRVTAQTIPTGVSRIHAPENAALAIDNEEDGRVNADVAVIDTGIDYTHLDLNVVARTNCVPTDEVEPEAPSCVDNSGTDGNGHGTHVAGTIGALDNGFGAVGVAPGARLWAVRVLNKDGWGYESWIVAGVDWVTAHASEIEVANMSLGCPCAQPALEEAISASVEAGVVYTIAAGNEGENAENVSPAKNPDAITVSALADYDGKAGGEGEPTCDEFGPDDSLASFSNWGPAVDVAAPGTCILSTVPYSGTATFGYGNYFGTLSGTSMAAPHVAGAAAVLASRSNPNSKADVEAIRNTIVEEGNSNWTDTSGDGVKEPLLDVSDESVFNPPYFRVSTNAATGVTPTEAVLHGIANPAGYEGSYQFEYGTTTSYGSKMPAPAKSIGSGIENVSFSQPITGLKPNTTYHFRVWVYRENNSMAGKDLTFKTPVPPPTVKTKAPTEIHLLGAELNGTVNPNGFETTYNFEYGPTTSYGYIAPVGWPTVHPVGSGTENVSLGQWGQEMKPNTTYHYRIMATNAGGTTYGEDMEVTTSNVDLLIEGMVYLKSPYLGSLTCTMYGSVKLNGIALDEGTLTDLGFRDCESGTAYLTGCHQVDTTFEGGDVSADPEASAVSIDNLQVTMTYKGGSCYAGGIHWHLSGSIEGTFYGGEEEAELTLDGSHLLYEDWNMFGSSMSIDGSLYMEGPPKLVP